MTADRSSLTSAQRAVLAWQTALHHAGQADSVRMPDVDTVIDLLVDLRHLAGVEGMDWTAMLQVVEMHWEAER